jgi:hypothetical protein
MTAKQIEIGGTYWMKVSDIVQKVKVTGIQHYARSSRPVYICRNLATGRECRAHSPAKFRVRADG